jgi:hypothetical protein
MRRTTVTVLTLAFGALAALLVSGSAAGGLGVRTAPSSFQLVFEGRDEPAPDAPGGWMHVGPFTASGPFCSSGHVTQLDARQSTQSESIVTRLHTCDDGSGSATALIESGVDEHGGRGAWRIVSGTGRYEELRGQGTFKSVRTSRSPTPPMTFVSTWNGVVDLDDTPPVLTVSQAAAAKLRRPRGSYRLRVEFSAVDAPGNAVRYLIAIRGGGWTLASTGGETATGGARVSLLARPTKRIRTLRVELTASDPLGNQSKLSVRVALPR